MGQVAEFFGVYSQGRFSEASQLRALLQYLEGKRLKISVMEIKPWRTNKQNRFMHGPFFSAVVAAHLESGQMMTLEQAKAQLKEDFGVRERVKGINGRWREILKSTAHYTTVECEDFMERVRAHYAEFGFELPYPNEHVTASPAHEAPCGAGIGGAV